MNLYQPTISGSLTVSGSVEIIGPFTMSGGSISGTSSFAANAGLLQGLDSTSFVGTGSYNTLSSSFTTVSSSYSAASGSFSTRVTTLETASGSFSGRVTKIEGNYATTGSNIFTGAQTVCANITSTGTIIAQTLNVQQVTSSVVYSSGSNVFGCALINTQQFTGSVTMTGSLTVTTAGTSPEFQVAVGGTTIGNALTDVHQVTGSLRITGSLTNTGVTTLNNQLQLSYANPDVSAIQITATTGTCASAMVFNNTGGNFYIGKDNSTGGRLTLSAVPYANAVWAENCCAISFGVGNVERFRISCNDIINIGNTTTANNKTIQFQVDTSLSYSGRIQMSNDTSILYLNGGGNIGYNFGAGIELVGKDRYACCHGGQLTLRAGNSVNNASFGYIAFETCNTERMRITIAGIACFSNVVCAKSLWFSANSTGQITFGCNDACNPYIVSDSNNVLYIGNNNSYKILVPQDGSDMIFRTSATYGNPCERMRITNGGCINVVGVGNRLNFDTTGGGSTIQLGTVNDYVFRLQNNRGVGTIIDLGNNHIDFYSNGSLRQRIFDYGPTCFACQVCAPNFITTGGCSSVRGGDSAFFRGSTVTQSGNSITFDAFRFLNPTGGLGGAASAISGRLYMTFQDTSTGGNQVSYQYLIFTTGNGVSPGPSCFVQLYCGPVRGTNPISAISLVNDGAGGAVKVQATTAASGVAGAVAYITFVGTAV